MKRILAGFGLIAAVAVLAPAPAAAAPFWQGQTLCASSNLSVCFSVTVDQLFSDGTNNTLRVTVVNQGSFGTLFTVGLFNTPSWSGSWNIVSATKTGVGDVTSDWKEGTQSLNTLNWGVVKENDVSTGIGVGQEVVFIIDFSPGFYITDDTGLAWHAGNLQISEKCITGDDEHGCSVVPEPISMILLGTGLAGVGGVGALRRRRKGLEIESA